MDILDGTFHFAAGPAFLGRAPEPPRACGVSVIPLFRRSPGPFASFHSLVGLRISFYTFGSDSFQLRYITK